MLFLISLVPATIWVVLGHLVLFSSTQTKGPVQRFGQILAIWVFLLAALFPAVGAYGTFTGFSPVNAMRSMHAQQVPQPGPQAERSATTRIAAPAS